MTNRRNLNRKGFTLIELIAVIVVLAILAGVALPKYFDYAADAKEAACKGILGGVRAGVANFYANEAITTGTGGYPDITEINDGSTMQEDIPDNPYDTGGSPGVVNVATAGEAVLRTVPVTAGTGGWAYDATTGTFYANTNVGGENAY